MTTSHYDVLVLGSGVAGGHVAGRCRRAGLSVALIEPEGFGGTCPLRGCEPKKVLADAAETVERLSNAGGLGVQGNARLDWKELMAFKRTFTSDLPRKIKQHYESLGIDTFTQAGRFVATDTIATGGTLLRGTHICIATGASTRPLDIPGADLLATSSQFLDLDMLPERIIFIGGGFIACELAHIAAAAGARVTMVHRSERFLRQFDNDLVLRLRTHLQEMGIAIHMNCPPHSVRDAEGTLQLHAGSNGEQQYHADLIVNAAGRVPALAALDLAAGNVQSSKGGVAVNSRMQSISNPAVYAAGDVIQGSMPLTPVAAMEAEVIARNIIDGTAHHIDYDITPYCLYTYPPLAAVGMLEEQAREQGRDFDVLSGDSSTWSEYRRIGQRCAGFKLLVEKQSRLLLGAHVMGDAAEETINLFALAMRKQVTVDELQSMLWAYPSFGYAAKYMFR